MSANLRRSLESFLNIWNIESTVVHWQLFQKMQNFLVWELSSQWAQHDTS